MQLSFTIFENYTPVSLSIIVDKEKHFYIQVVLPC